MLHHNKYNIVLILQCEKHVKSFSQLCENVNNQHFSFVSATYKGQKITTFDKPEDENKIVIYNDYIGSFIMLLYRYNFYLNNSF